MIRSGLSALLALSLGVPLCAASDVRAMATPEPLSANVLGIKTLGRWVIAVVNYSDHEVRLSQEMVLMAFPKLHRVDPVDLQRVLEDANSNSWSSRGLAALDYASIPLLAFMGGQVFKVSAATVSKAAIGDKLIQKFGANLKAKQPDVSKYGDTLPQVIVLSPYGQAGFSASYKIYCGKIKGADTFEAPIFVPDSSIAPKPAVKSASFEVAVVGLPVCAQCTGD